MINDHTVGNDDPISVKQGMRFDPNNKIHTVTPMITIHENQCGQDGRGWMEAVSQREKAQVVQQKDGIIFRTNQEIAGTCCPSGKSPKSKHEADQSLCHEVG